LAELVQDDDFRASIRRMAEYQARERAEGVETGSAADRELVGLVMKTIGAALEAGTDPTAPAAGPVLDEVSGAFARLYHRTDDREFRTWLAERLETGSDPRAERYWQLIGAINGWSAAPSLAPAFGWLIAALQAA
jgi:hypothetical protein